MIDTAIRARGIGGSEVAAIMGLDSRRDAFSVYLDKLGLVRRSAPSGRMKWGKRIEQAIAEAYGEETGQEVEWCDETTTHVEPVRFATVEESALMAKLKTVGEQWDEVNGTYLTVENQLKAAIGTGEGLLTVNGWKLTWRKEKDSEGPDWEAVARELGLRL